MKIIIFAGGTGTRFWPASRKSTPKQFLSVIDNKPLIRLKYEYLIRGFEPKDIFLSTGAQYQNEVSEILPELPRENFIFEPEMRDNGPAVAFAISYVNKKHPNETLSFQWSDHYIKKPDLFIHALKEAEKVVLSENKSVVVAETARYPSPYLGHIQFGKKIKSLDENGRVSLSEFVRFVEKPTLEIAERYMQSGDYGWNTGYFVTTFDNVMDKYRQFAPQIYETVNEIAANDFKGEGLKKYAKLDKISIDYVFAENLDPQDALVINTNMGWSDVGAWQMLKEAMEDSPEGNVISGNVHDVESKDTLVHNYEDKKLVATIGLEGMVVVNTKDVIAIFPKRKNGKLREVLQNLEQLGLEQYL